MVEFFIRRPIFATVCALLIVLAGAVTLPTIPISLYPQLAPPQVVVSSNYVGANSQDVESAVTIILEQAINGVEGMRYMSSTSANDGTSTITITFQTGYDLDIAAVDVQNRVATAQGRLPAAVNNTGISITKANSNFVLAAGFIFAGPLGSRRHVHLELPGRIRFGRVEARAGRRQRHYLRRAQVCDAHLAGPKQTGGARLDAAGRDQRPAGTER